MADQAEHEVDTSSARTSTTPPRRPRRARPCWGSRTTRGPGLAEQRYHAVFAQLFEKMLILGADPTHYGSSGARAHRMWRSIAG